MFDCRPRDQQVLTLRAHRVGGQACRGPGLLPRSGCAAGRVDSQGMPCLRTAELPPTSCVSSVICTLGSPCGLYRGVAAHRLHSQQWVLTPKGRLVGGSGGVPPPGCATRVLTCRDCLIDGQRSCRPQAPRQVFFSPPGMTLPVDRGAAAPRLRWQWVLITRDRPVGGQIHHEP